jgi:serine/threonine-protein kinase
LTHPNIVAAYAVGEDFGVHWYSMEFCPGQPLDAKLKADGALPWQDAVRIITQVAAGLAHAHAHQIIHRDIKPANIIIAANGTAKILDFGLAKQLGGGQSLMTQTGVVMGTPHYIAPEQSRGDKGIDGRADLYALGATLYHLVTGVTPFSGASPAAVIMQHLNDELPDPRERVAELPSGLVAIIRRLMAKRPADRYADAESLIADLDLVAAGQQPRHAANDSPTALARRRDATQDPDYRAAYLIASVVILALVGGWWLTRPVRASSEATEVAEPLPTTQPVVVDTPAPAPPGRIIPLPPPPEPAPTPPVTTPTTADVTPQPVPSATTTSNARTIDLLRLVDPAQDAVYGTWIWSDGALLSDASGAWTADRGAARLALPYRPQGEYDFRIQFTRRSGNHCVSQILVAKGQAYAWIMGGWGNTIFGFENFRGMHSNEAANTTRVIQGSCLTTGQRHEAVLRVRREGAIALFDGREISRTPREYHDLTSPPVYHLRGHPGQLGIASWESPTAFHVIEVVEISGQGTLIR